MSGSTGSGGEKSAAPSPAPPSRPRHHFTRSLSELSSPIARFHRHTQSHIQREGRDSRTGRDGRDGREGKEGREDRVPSSSSAAASSSSSLSPSARGTTLAQQPSAETSTTLIPTATATSTRSSLEIPTAEPEPAAPQQHQHQHHHWLHTSHSNANIHATSIAALAAAASAAAAVTPTQMSQMSSMAFPTISAHMDDVERAREAAEDGGEGGNSGEVSAVAVAAAAAAAVAGAPADFVPHAVAPGVAAPSTHDTATATATVAALQRLQHEQARDAARLLRATVAELSELSTTASQRLDAAYGSALARIGALQGTVLALQTLAVAAAATNRHFAADTAAVTREVEQQIAQFEGESSTTNQHRQRLLELARRVHDGREAVQALSARVDAVRRRVERWERADRAWQERTRRRLKVLWVIVSSVVLVLLVLLVMMVRSRGQAGAEPAGKTVDTGYVDGASAGATPPLGPSGRIPADIAIPGLTAPTGEKLPFHLLFPGNNETDSSAAEDEPLRILDEL